MTEPNATSSHDSAADPMRGIADSLATLGIVWAQHGIAMGRLALRTQSAWLRGLSTLLGQVADAMEPLTRSTHGAEPTTDDRVSH